MYVFPGSGCKKWLALLLLPLVVACSTAAPGMSFNPSETVAESSPEAATTQKPIMKTITPELVKLQREQRKEQATQDISHLSAAPKPYGIQSGDILSIIVWDHPELAGTGTTSASQSQSGAPTESSGSPSSGFVVDHAGTIQYPYIGRINMAGLTEAQAQKTLTAKLAYYIQKPNVTLRVESYRSKRIYVDGEVKAPGVLPITDIPMTLMEALNRAGGMLPSADQSQITISRDGKNYLINLPQLVRKGGNPNAIMLANGDVVRVQSSDESKVFVSGEVVQPGALLMHNGTLTLNEALGEVGGINPATGGRHIYVIRNGADQRPVVYHLDTKSAERFSLAENFNLQPKDVVYVDAAPLAAWNRTISLLLPSALSQGVSAGSSAGAARPR